MSPIIKEDSFSGLEPKAKEEHRGCGILNSSDDEITTTGCHSGIEWRNVFSIGLLHFGAIAGLALIFNGQVNFLTLIFGKLLTAEQGTV